MLKIGHGFGLAHSAGRSMLTEAASKVTFSFKGFTSDELETFVDSIYNERGIKTLSVSGNKLVFNKSDSDEVEEILVDVLDLKHRKDFTYK